MEESKETPVVLGANPKDLIGSNKVPLSYIPPAALVYTVLGMWDGIKKYGKWNWRKNRVIASIYTDALFRHVEAWIDGEDNAPDSGKPHLAHALATLAVLVDAIETGNLEDDRPPAGSAARLLEEWRKKP